ncbi:MAG: hypothetical protein SOZ80_04225 [Prevotella sp.]|uniref:DUF6850 family outer membrane beta-barrel protein n=1 Tax=Prevotella sp. TaxID=59823 RepID=UPI002A259535|nr:DUF6850 family outer membrane beta-barrel protein [Prevotella sp.]MDD7318942.1 hypothetical protein [Prevotellaceae bacterium]MDY4019968.1 hypothetical protein [Prevotella sp.]
MNRLYLCLALLSVTTVPAASSVVGEQPLGEADSAICVIRSSAEHHNIFLNTQNSWFANPALRFEAYGSTYGELGVYADKRREDEAFVMQEGNVLRNIGIRAATYRRLFGKDNDAGRFQRSATVVWGEASYQNGRRDNVEWNSSSDWNTIRPYVLADTLGGDRNTERYAFNGGCATSFGQWTIGEELTFRAEHEWSVSDPRMRGITTELNMRMGISRRISNHWLALGAALKLYKQTNSVEFFREEGVVPEYQMSGLGNWYERFSGTNNKAYYKATGCGADFAIRPTAGNGGIILTAGYEYTPYKRILSSLNALPISRLHVTRWQARLGWKGMMKASPMSDKGVAVWLGTDGEKRRGDEIIGGESIANEYAVRGYLSMYANRYTDVFIGTTANFALGRNHLLALVLQGGHRHHSSSYAYPHSELHFSHNHFGATLQWQAKGRHLLVAADIGCRYYRNVSGAFTTTADDTYTSPLKDDVAAAKKRMTERCVADALASYTMLSFGLRAEYVPKFMSGMGLFAETRAEYRKNDVGNDNRGYALHASVGITF